MLRAAAAVAALLVLVTPSHAAAQKTATSFADVRITSGSWVTVLDRTGHEISGRVATLSNGTLSLVVDGKPQQIKEADALRISRKGDSLNELSSLVSP